MWLVYYAWYWRCSLSQILVKVKFCDMLVHQAAVDFCCSVPRAEIMGEIDSILALHSSARLIAFLVLRPLSKSSEYGSVAFTNQIKREDGGQCFSLRPLLVGSLSLLPVWIFAALTALRYLRKRWQPYALWEEQAAPPVLLSLTYVRVIRYPKEVAVTRAWFTHGWASGQGRV